MAVYLVQHGKSLPKEKDPDKGLSDTGRQETIKIADVAKMYQVPVSVVGHSGKARAGNGWFIKWTLNPHIR